MPHAKFTIPTHGSTPAWEDLVEATLPQISIGMSGLFWLLGAVVVRLFFVFVGVVVAAG